MPKKVLNPSISRRERSQRNLEGGVQNFNPLAPEVEVKEMISEKELSGKFLLTEKELKQYVFYTRGTSQEQEALGDLRSYQKYLNTCRAAKEKGDQELFKTYKAKLKSKIEEVRELNEKFLVKEYE